MIRITLAALASALCFTAPAMAQLFSHSHGGHSHSHDTTTYITSGTCCYDNGCGNAHGSFSTLAGAPMTARTYTRTYTQAPTITRTYNQSAPRHYSSRRTYTHPAHRQHHGHHRDHHRGHDRAPIYHTDRGEAWAHYDRRWKRRTNTRRRHHH